MATLLFHLEAAFFGIGTQKAPLKQSSGHPWSRTRCRILTWRRRNSRRSKTSFRAKEVIRERGEKKRRTKS